MTLADLKKGEVAIIEDISGDSDFKKRLFELGFMKGTTISINNLAPFNGPILVELKGYKLLMRIEDANNVIVEKNDN